MVVALGGNAISRADQEGNVNEQFENSRITARQLVGLIEQGYQLVITHGNGPQIGNFLLRNEAAKDAIYPLPMEVAVAHVQGGMGFMIAHTLNNELASRGRDESATAIVTTVVVDADDPSFSDPTKPIGRALDTAQAEKHRSQGWEIREVAGGKFRRVIASPTPKEIIELDHIRRSIEAGEILVVCGGGGIPVCPDSEGHLHGVRAVIDKDLVSALLATSLGADLLMILTDVDSVRINFGKPNEQSIDRMTLGQAREWMEAGQFPAGTMGPKIQGAIDFLKQTQAADPRAVIGPLDRAVDAIDGKTGTSITRS